MGKQQLDSLRDELKMFYGQPPYDDPGNPCRGDGYFVISLEKKYGRPWKELCKLVRDSDG